MKLYVFLFLSSVTIALGFGPIAGQEIPRGEYLLHLPLSAPRLVSQTPANAALHLFGDRDDPGYRDVKPVDGIDDTRHGVLMDLALRFAPFLVQNTDNVPTDFQAFIDNRDSFPLWVDTWDVSRQEPRLLGTRGINFSALGQGACPDSLRGRAFEARPQPSSDGAVEDCKVLELMDRFSPGGGEVRPLDESLVRGRPNLVSVAFFNMPGEGERTWKGVVVDEYERTPPARRGSFPHSFIHPFLARRFGDDGALLGYELTLQYWFYYPYNDSGMNHEGDWEHINVTIAPRSLVDQPLSRDVVTRILDGSLPATDDAPDPLVIRRVDYYLHHLVMPLDFAEPNAYLPREAWEADVRNRPQPRFREKEIWGRIRYMAWADEAETAVNTHPLVYIGADNKGLNQALELPGPGNKDPHASYPFPGRYPNVGPGGTTDQVGQRADIREIIRRRKEGSLNPGPVFEAGAVLDLARADRLRILPDWERLVDLARGDSSVRRDWAWMLLPIRWGYPATRSPFSGFLEHYDLGNNGPIGPTYNTAWNVSGAAPGYTYYEPHTVPDVFPIQVQDNFRNGLGFLNLTLPVLFNLPPLDIVARLAAYPFRLALGRSGTVYFPNESLPYRFFGVSSGLSHQLLDQNFDAMAVNPQQVDQFIDGFLGHLFDNGFNAETQIVSGREFMNDAVAPFVNIPFYLGDHVVSENMVRNVRASFGLDIGFSNIPPFSYDADINLWEYAGGFRYIPFDWRLGPYVKGGYGWSWYRLENARIKDTPLTPANSAWIKPKTLWPNVWHYGLGLEVVPWKRSGAGISGLEFGIRLEYARYHQDLDLKLSSIPLETLSELFPTLGDLPQEEVVRDDFVLAFTISF